METHTSGTPYFRLAAGTRVKYFAHVLLTYIIFPSERYMTQRGEKKEIKKKNKRGKKGSMCAPYHGFFLACTGPTGRPPHSVNVATSAHVAHVIKDIAIYNSILIQAHVYKSTRTVSEIRVLTTSTADI